MMEVDSTHITVPMSRWPEVVESRQPLQSQSKLSKSPEVAKIQSSGYSVSPSVSPSSNIRRKPKVTYRAPEADTPLRIEGHARPSSKITNTDLSSHKAAIILSSDKSLLMPPPDSVWDLRGTTDSIRNRATSPVFLPSPPLFKMRSPLPNYHPLSFKSTMSSLEARRKSESNKIAPATSLVSDEDRDGGRRSSSRTRKPAAKLRETEHIDSVEESKESNTYETGELGTGGTKKESPKRKRTNATSGSRKRKRDNTTAVERDTPYPKRKSRATRINEAAKASAIGSGHVDMKANTEHDEEGGNDVEAVSLKLVEDQKSIIISTMVDSRIPISHNVQDSTATESFTSPSEANIDAHSDLVSLDTPLSNLISLGSPRKSSRRSVMESHRFKLARRNSATSATTTQTDKAENSLPSMGPAPQPKRVSVKTLSRELVINHSNITIPTTSVYKSKSRKADDLLASEEATLAANPGGATSENKSQTPVQQSIRASRKTQTPSDHLSVQKDIYELPAQDVSQSTRSYSNYVIPEKVASLAALDDNEVVSQKVLVSRKSTSRRRGSSFSVIGSSGSTARNKSRARAKADKHNSGASEASAVESVAKEQHLLTPESASGEVAT